MSVRVGIAGVTGYGGIELLRLCVAHPAFEVVYATGETTVGQRLEQRYPHLAGHPAGRTEIQRFVPEEIAGVDLLFASLPAGESKGPLAAVPDAVKVVDVGGDHRFVEGWTYGLTELPGARAQIAASRRVADPGCYPAATLLALAPLVANGLVEPEGIVADAKSGVSGAGRGGGGAYGYSETNEDIYPYGLLRHDHVREMREALSRLAGAGAPRPTRVAEPGLGGAGNPLAGVAGRLAWEPAGRRATIAFTPHLAPMTRGLLATCYARPRGTVTTEQALDAARAFYRDEPFVKVVELDASANGGRGAHTKWAAGSNLAFVTYAVNAETGLVVAVGAIDNLGKGAAGQAVQNANLMTGQPETAGLTALPLWP